MVRDPATGIVTFVCRTEDMYCVRVAELVWIHTHTAVRAYTNVSTNSGVCTDVPVSTYTLHAHTHTLTAASPPEEVNVRLHKHAH